MQLPQDLCEKVYESVCGRAYSRAKPIADSIQGRMVRQVLMPVRLPATGGSALAQCALKVACCCYAAALQRDAPTRPPENAHTHTAKMQQWLRTAGKQGWRRRVDDTSASERSLQSHHSLNALLLVACMLPRGENGVINSSRCAEYIWRYTTEQGPCQGICQQSGWLAGHTCKSSVMDGLILVMHPLLEQQRPLGWRPEPCQPLRSLVAGPPASPEGRWVPVS